MKSQTNHPSDRKSLDPFGQRFYAVIAAILVETSDQPSDRAVEMSTRMESPQRTRKGKRRR